MRRFAAGTSMPALLSNSTRSPTPILPPSGRSRPATRLSTVLLPQPERPKRAVTVASDVNAACSLNAPRRRSTSISMRIAEDPAVRARHEQLRRKQRDERKEHRDHAQTHRLRVAAGHLRVGVDRERQRLRLAWNVRHERNRRAELAEAAREGKQHAGDD